MLAGRLWRSDGFWGHAEEVADAGHSVELAREKARLAVPRGPKNRDALAALIYTASRHRRDRYVRRGRPGRALAELVQPAGPIAYFPEGSPLEPRRRSKYVKSKGSKLRPEAAVRLQTGAEAVALRLGVRCLMCGKKLSARRERSYSPLDRPGTIHADYCEGCHPDESKHGRTVAAMQAVLEPAADYLGGLEEVVRYQSVVGQIRRGDASIGSEALPPWARERGFLESGATGKAGEFEESE